MNKYIRIHNSLKIAEIKLGFGTNPKSSMLTSSKGSSGKDIK